MVAGKGSVTVSQVLHHQAGLANAALEELQRDPFLACDSTFMASVVAESTPEKIVRAAQFVLNLSSLLRCAFF